MTDQCPVCGSTKYRDHVIHGGISIRRDCDSCLKYDKDRKKSWRPFIRFVKWKGVDLTDGK